MNVKQLREIINNLSEDYDKFDVVNGEVMMVGDSTSVRIDKEIIAVYVDDASESLCFFHQTREDVLKNK